jgi:hypothetical protein
LPLPAPVVPLAGDGEAHQPRADGGDEKENPGYDEHTPHNTARIPLPDNTSGDALTLSPGVGMMVGVEYEIVYERSTTGWSAYVPALPGLIATGATRDEVERLIREGIPFHTEP